MTPIKVKTFNSIIGKTLTYIGIEVPAVSSDLFNYREKIIFVASDGTRWKMGHAQECCEDVYIESIDGKLSNLIGDPILLAEKVSNESKTKDRDASGTETWTFYKFGTCEGQVTIRWYGSSNGYYSEEVEFRKYKVKKRKQP